MKKEKIDIILDQQVYPMEAIYAAAYVFIEKVYIYLAMKNGKTIMTLTAKEGVTSKQLEKISGEFLNELLNSSLRHSLSKNNKKLRQTIIEMALFSSVSENDVWAEENEADDIPLPWEENK